MPYPPSDPTQPIDELEKQLLAKWKSERLFTRVSDATRYGPPFVFFEGPPTANGRPGIHHVFSRTLKDLICRYHTMLGQGVTRIAGWDTHGLPVEIEVEKALNINGKREIEAYGIERFNKLCRARALNSATPYDSIAFFPLSCSSFSTSISTGRPWVSHPAMRVTSWPCIAW